MTPLPRCASRVGPAPSPSAQLHQRIAGWKTRRLGGRSWSCYVEIGLLRDYRALVVGPGELELAGAGDAHVEGEVRVGRDAWMQLGLEDLRAGEGCGERIDDEARD